MAVNEKSLKNLEKGNKFSSENQPENNGRKPSYLSFIREQDVSISDIRKVIGNLIWNYDSEELTLKLKTKKVKIKDENGKTKTVTKTIIPLPMGINLVLNALNDDLQKKRLINFNSLMDRAYGKSTQTIDIPPETLARISMTPEERRKKIEELLKKSESKPRKSGRKRTGRTVIPS